MTSAGGFVAPAFPWLCQGDLFRSAPVLYYPDLSHDFLAQLRMGPAMLVTHDCALDKMNSKGVATIERMTFVRIRKLATAPEHRQQLMKTKATELTPLEAQYLGHLEGLGESYVSLSDPYYLPAAYFEGETKGFPGLDHDDKRLSIAKHDTRFARLGDEALALFRNKWNGYWTRTVPKED